MKELLLNISTFLIELWVNLFHRVTQLIELLCPLIGM